MSSKISWLNHFATLLDYDNEFLPNVFCFFFLSFNFNEVLIIVVFPFVCATDYDKKYRFPEFGL